MSNLRKCVVTTENYNHYDGWFDSWVTVDEVRISTRRDNAGSRELQRVLRGIVIFEDGTVYLARPEAIIFDMEGLKND